MVRRFGGSVEDALIRSPRYFGSQWKDSNLNIRQRGIDHENGLSLCRRIDDGLPDGSGARAQESVPYKVLKIQLTGGEGGWDDVTADPTTGELALE